MKIWTQARSWRGAEDQGFEVSTSRKGYPLVYRDEAFVTKAAHTTSDLRSQRNIIDALRRPGLIWPPR